MNEQLQDRIRTHVAAYILSHEANHIKHDEDWNHFVEIMTSCANDVVSKLCNDKLIQERTLYMFRGDKQHGRGLINRLVELGYENKNKYSGESEDIIYFGTCGIIHICDINSEWKLLGQGFKTLKPQNDMVISAVFGK